MNLISKIHRTLFSKDLDHRFAKSLKKANEAEQLAASINQRLFEIQKKLKSTSVKYS